MPLLVETLIPIAVCYAAGVWLGFLIFGRPPRETFL